MYSIHKYAIVLKAKLKKKKQLQKEGKEESEEYKQLKEELEDSALTKWGLFQLFELFYFIVLVVGLLSSQWVGFIAILILSFIPKRTVTFRKFDGVLSMLILLFILLNKYQFHIHWNDLILGLLGIQ